MVKSGRFIERTKKRLKYKSQRSAQNTKAAAKTI
jgi:hypothetical protein